MVKLLWYDGQGMCLFSKRLERGHFVWPVTETGRVSLTPAQLKDVFEEVKTYFDVNYCTTKCRALLDSKSTDSELLDDRADLLYHLLVVLESLSPGERVAFVLHDVFAVPFDDIAPIVGRSSAATRQLASRGRRRVQGAPIPDADLDGQWAVVDAFLAASRDGDFERLLDVLDPDVTLRSDGGTSRPGLVTLVLGAQGVASSAMSFRAVAANATRTLVNGAPGGVAWTPDRRPFAVISFTVSGGRIVEIDVLADPDRLATLDLHPADARSRGRRQSKWRVPCCLRSG